jgi:hypothetical protein
MRRHANNLERRAARNAKPVSPAIKTTTIASFRGKADIRKLHSTASIVRTRRFSPDETAAAIFETLSLYMQNICKGVSATLDANALP